MLGVKAQSRGDQAQAVRQNDTSKSRRRRVESSAHWHALCAVASCAQHDMTPRFQVSNLSLLDPVKDVLKIFAFIDEANSFGAGAAAAGAGQQMQM